MMGLYRQATRLPDLCTHLRARAERTKPSTFLVVVGVGVALLSIVFSWLWAPLGVGFSGGWFRFGVAAALVLFCLPAFLLRSWNLIALLGVTLVGLCALFVVHFGIYNPVFWRVVDQSYQYDKLINFSNKELPRNNGYEPDLKTNIQVSDLGDRLSAAFYFVGTGWKCCAVAALFILAAVFYRRAAIEFMIPAIFALVLFIPLAVMLYSGYRAQKLEDRSDNLMACGHLREALRGYGKLQGLNAQREGEQQIYLEIGAARCAMGQINAPASLFYKGYQSEENTDYDNALAYYHQALTGASARFGKIIRNRIAWCRIDWGNSYYVQQEYGPAASQWAQALRIDPQQLQAAYYLSSAYFELGQYEDCLRIGALFLRESNNTILKANVYANMGDAYWRMSKSDLARRSYQKSYDLDDFQNFRNYLDLGGT